MKFSLQNAYINSHFNRLMWSNKYMGPDERKTWRNSVGNQPSLHQAPTRSGAQENYNSEIKASPESSLDPDCPAKRTRSGHIYHTVCAHHKPIITHSATQSTSADGFLQMTPSALEVLQKGQQSSESHLTVLERQALQLQQKDLYPSYQLAWRLPTPKKTKTVTISNQIQVRHLDQDLLL